MSLSPVPDKSFVKAMKKEHPDLDVVWDRVMELWCIYYTAPDNAHVKLLEIKNEDGSFRPLDSRTLELINLCDWTKRTGSAAENARKSLERRKEAVEKQKLKQREEIEYKAKQLRSKLDKAFDNADRGIFYDWQIRQPKIISDLGVSPRKGLVDLYGRPLTLTKENNYVNNEPNACID